MSTLTLFTMGEIFIIFSIFSDICYFSKYMKNKIGILENDIYIFPIVNSVILLSVQFSHGLEGSTAYVVLQTVKNT